MEYIMQWLSDHPQFQKNRLYIAGDSYAGKIVPMVVSEIKKGQNFLHITHFFICRIADLYMFSDLCDCRH